MATPFTEALERSDERVTMGSIDRILDLYFGGDLDAGFAMGGQVAGRIDEIVPVARIIEETVEEFHAVCRDLGRRHGSRAGGPG